MKILVTGSRGQLGRELYDVLEERLPGHTVYTGTDELNITDAAAVKNFLQAGDFTHIINCAAYTNVELAEEDKHKCYAVNAEGVRNIGSHAGELGVKVLHVSTDYVFDGRSCRPYTEGDKVNPTSEYGSSKRKGETALLGLAPESIIIRTGWLYSPNGHNFLNTMIRLGAERNEIKVVFDQIGTPTYARDLAETIATMVVASRWIPGTYHYSNEGACSWYDFAVDIMDGYGLKCKVIPITSADFPSAVIRPPFSVLDKSRIKATYGIEIPHWRDGLRRCLNRMTDQNK
ncbi:MAG: dTDP-4-dehydrorhamnose reductase [Muribaculaceae bacterium]|nr:dTDP-4-dehydrorhamnose reductase [Muribaculaceae bacterium]